MKWVTVRLEECCLSISDGDHQPPPKSEKGIPFVTISDITGTNQFSFENTAFVPEEYYNRLDAKRKVAAGDILYSVVGSFGIPVLIQKQTPLVFQRHIAILKPNETIVDPRFLYYTMLSREFYAKADAVAIGAAQRTISLSALRNIKISLPELSVQYKIAETLSAYDNLIENNQKQIKLLEEAAQRLYQEWFVDLHFPGYEDTQVVDGVPEGWHIGTIQEIVEYHDKRRKPLSSMQRASFKGEYRYYGAAGILDYVAKYLFDGTYLLFGEDGTVITTDGTPVLQYVAGKFWVNNHAHVLTGKAPYTTEFIYMMFLKMRISDVVTGVAQPKISQARLSAKKVLIPASKAVQQYQNVVASMFDRILLLEKQIELAKQARDLLLPKLMSGELEV